LVIAGSNAIANDSNFFGNNAGDYAANAYVKFLWARWF
jgi:hypothetical protein